MLSISKKSPSDDSPSKLKIPDSTDKAVPFSPWEDEDAGNYVSSKFINFLDSKMRNPSKLRKKFTLKDSFASIPDIESYTQKLTDFTETDIRLADKCKKVSDLLPLDEESLRRVEVSPVSTKDVTESSSKNVDNAIETKSTLKGLEVNKLSQNQKNQNYVVCDKKIEMHIDLKQCTKNPTINKKMLIPNLKERPSIEDPNNGNIRTKEQYNMKRSIDRRNQSFNLSRGQRVSLTDESSTPFNPLVLANKNTPKNVFRKEQKLNTKAEAQNDNKQSVNIQIRLVSAGNLELSKEQSLKEIGTPNALDENNPHISINSLSSTEKPRNNDSPATKMRKLRVLGCTYSDCMYPKTKDYDHSPASQLSQGFDDSSQFPQKFLYTFGSKDFKINALPRSNLTSPMSITNTTPVGASRPNTTKAEGSQRLEGGFGRYLETVIENDSMLHKERSEIINSIKLTNKIWTDHKGQYEFSGRPLFSKIKEQFQGRNPIKIERTEKPKSFNIPREKKSLESILKPAKPEVIAIEPTEHKINISLNNNVAKIEPPRMSPLARRRFLVNKLLKTRENLGDVNLLGQTQLKINEKPQAQTRSSSETRGLQKESLDIRPECQGLKFSRRGSCSSHKDVRRTRTKIQN